MKRFIIIGLIAALFACTSTNTVTTEQVAAKEKIVRVNQVGYLPAGEKYFMVEDYMGGFDIVDENSNIVYSGTTELWKENDTSTGMTLFKGDFSDFTESGSYKIVLVEGSESYIFSIDESVFNETRNLSLKSFYLQRSGMDIEKEYAGKYARPAGHTNDLKYHPTSPIQGKKDVSGGWYDAGDFGRYITPGAVTLGIMMMGYEQYPEKFDFDNNSIPESGNGISDFLDEMRYELEWMLKMQYKEEGEFNGALPYMVNSKDYVWELPHIGSQPQWIYDFSSISTATFTAVLAQGSRLFKGIDDDFSNKCLEAAMLSWEWLENNGTYPKNGFQRPSDTQTGGYAYSASDNKEDKDDRAWAAVEMYLTTGEDKYHEAAQKRLKKLNMGGFDMNWMNTHGFAKIQYVLANTEDANVNLQNKIKDEFLKHCDSMVKTSSKDGFKTVMNSGDYYWGSNGEVLTRAKHLIYANLLTGDDKYYTGALNQLNYVLGLNGHNMSFVAGLGTVYPTEIHHAVTATDGTDGSYPGLIAGGPNQSIDNDTTMPMYFTNSTPNALCYIDHIDSWASNENCITYNAPLIPVSAFFSN